MSAPALRGEGLTLRLGGRSVVDDVSVAFAPGSFTAVVGPNGAGKSTLLSLLAGLRAPHAGRVWLQGRPLDSHAPRQRAQALAWLSQQGEADGDIAVLDVVRLGRLPRHGLLGAPDAGDEAAVQLALAATETAAFAARRLSELSGGERQRVLLARALAVEAPVLLLDEPATHLDAPHQRALSRGLRERAAAGATVVAVMHDLTQALGADRLLVLRQGRVLGEGAPGDAALHAALAQAFGGAFGIQAVPTPAGPRWVAVPAP